MRIDEVIAQILVKEPATWFEPVKPEWIDEVEAKYPGMPADLRHLYMAYGYGTIGYGRYTIQCLLEPDDINDPETAAELAGILIVGDDFAGGCEANDAANGWRFGTIGEDGKFEPDSDPNASITRFLEEWFLAD